MEGAFIAIAWRNLWRNRRRTAVTAAAIAFSVAITIYTIAMMDGSHDAMLRLAVRFQTGDAQIHRPGYRADPGLDKSFALTQALVKAVEGNGEIESWSPRLETGALAASRTGSLGVFLAGVEPQRESRVTVIAEKVVRGRYLEGGAGKECVIGEKAAADLGVDAGGSVVLLSQGRDGSMGAGRYKVAGVFRTGSDELDQGFACITLRDAQELLQAPGLVNSVAILTRSPASVPGVVAALAKALPDREVLGWRELMPELVQLLTLDSIGGYIFLALLFIVVVFGILSSLFMSVLERTREFGLLLALGTRPGQVVLMVMLEALLLAAVGVTAGTALGLGLSVYGIHHPINLPSSTESVASYFGMENRIFFALYPANVGFAVLGIVALSLLFSLYPAWRASRLRPDRALREMN